MQLPGSRKLYSRVSIVILTETVLPAREKKECVCEGGGDGAERGK